MSDEERIKKEQEERIRREQEKRRLDEERKRIALTEEVKKGIGSGLRPKK
ncbi:hypothetical protein [Flavobacterium difficile]|uniref:Uncharacterized protein n=1 Tax=Flavobacterium difficile TaxID=2709659 RepID=A0ABX0I6N8_9FLAO|nr:hypothetical protein [Flavobacterium difficile]NHM01469.1 hypothetical protein [Flavobacterium difficile]